MSIGKVQINNLNLSQGEITAVENHLLFVGSGKGDKVGKLLTVNTDHEAIPSPSASYSMTDADQFCPPLSRAAVT